MQRSFSVIGGDRRQAELARLLAEDGCAVCTYGLGKWGTVREASLEQALLADVIILPLPLCQGEGLLNCEESPVPTLELFQRLGSGQLVLAGQVKDERRREAESCGVCLTDYFLREELVIANAAATAEGAIQIAMERLDRTLLGLGCLVLGFGRIGRLLSHRLHGLGAKVTVAARKSEDLAWIRAYGWRALNTGDLDGTLGHLGVVFNTVPSLILNEALLQQLPNDCLCVELASVQGIDLAAADRMKIPNVWARSLPGKLAPLTAAAAIRDTVYYIINNK